METILLFLRITLLQSVRYVVIAGGAYLIISKWFPSFFRPLRIQPKKITAEQAGREFRQSLISAVLFGVIFSFVANPWVQGFTKIYTHADQHSRAWLYLSVPALILVNDTYFYWMHRMIHHPKLFNIVHRTHHLSTNPSPLASFSFHPTEVVLEGLWIIPVVFLIPLYQPVLIVYSFVSFLNNVRGHLGVEVIPLHMRRRIFPLNWINSPTHHSHHHQYFGVNYGLYFMFWDRLCKTEKNYDLFETAGSSGILN